MASLSARRSLRSELELLRRIGVCLNRSQAEPTSTLLNKYGDHDRQELATIARDAADPIVREMIDAFDRELGSVRKEIMMSVIDDEAQKIAHEVLESGVMALTAEHPSTGEPKTDAVDAGDSIESVESALAVAEADLADAVGILQEVSEDVDMVATARDAGGEALPDEDAPPAAAEVPSWDAESTDPIAQATADLAAAPKPEAPIASQEEASDASGDGSADGPGAGDDSVVDREDKLDKIAAMEPIAPDFDAPARDTVAANCAALSAVATPEIAETQAEVPPPEDANARQVAAEALTAPRVGEADGPAPALAPKATEPGRPEAAAVPTSSVAESEPMQCAATGGLIERDATPERANRAVQEIEAGIRKLTALLSQEVSDQWKQASDAMHEVLGAKQFIDESLAQAQTTLAELSRVNEEAGIARSEADVARREARIFRQDAERAKQRCDRSAKAAELASDQAAAEAQAAAKMLRDACPQPV